MAPLLLVVELAEEVGVGEGRADHQPFRLVVLLAGLGGEEHRQDRVAAAGDRGDALVLQLGDDAGRLGGEHRRVEGVGDADGDVAAALLDAADAVVDAVLVPGDVGGDQRQLAGLALEGAAGVLGRLADQSA